MKCDVDDECASSVCENGYCKKIKFNYGYSWKNTLIFLIVVIPITAGILYVLLNLLIHYGIFKDPKDYSQIMIIPFFIFMN